MRLDVRNFRELLLQTICGAQDVGLRGSGASSISSACSPSGYVLEIHGGLGDRVPRHDETIDRRVRGDFQGAVNSGGGEDDENADNPEPRAQHAEENLMHRFRGSHSRGAPLMVPGAPGPAAHGNDSLKT